MNWVIFLSFDDGVEWVFRSPILENGFPPETCGELLESEVATMKYIKSNSSIPVPDIFDHCSTASNDIGIPFILMSKAPGSQLGDFGWVPMDSSPKSCLTKAQREKILYQLGTIASQLLNLKFEKLGSIFKKARKYEVGRCLSPGLMFHDRHTLDDIPRGPFHSDSEYYNALLSAFEVHIYELRIQHNVFFAPIPTRMEFETQSGAKAAHERWEDLVAVGEKVDSARNRMDYYIVKYLMNEMIPRICGESSSSLNTNEFALYHQDLNSGNIFVDRDFNITCVIDWTFASTVPCTTVLATPSLPNPRDPHDSTLDDAFRKGFVGHKFQLDVWEQARKTWLFTRLIMLDGVRDYHYFKELYTLVYTPQGCLSVLQLFRDVETKLLAGGEPSKHTDALPKGENVFLELHEELDEDDPSNVTEREQRYFDTCSAISNTPKHLMKELSMERHTIARKITVARDLTKVGEFVADAKLWRWIENSTA